MTTLAEMKARLLPTATGEMARAIASLGVVPRRPLGKLNIWTWWPELVRGCNLHCAFCPTRLFPRGEYRYMARASWEALLRLVAELTPHGRIGLASLGEPTLHPEYLDFIRIARRLAPRVQLLTYTNGTTLLSGKMTYRAMFEAGLNCVFTDMYAAYDVHRRLAEASGFEFYHESERPASIPNVFEYRDDPDRHTIRLSENPYNWSARKMGRGEFHTFLNQLDWPAATKFGIVPVTTPPRRRCDQPSKFVNVMVDGSYQVCCAAHPTLTDRFGFVTDGLEGFFKFWLGPYMQDVRHRLHYKDRAAHELCRSCAYVTIRADIPIWKGGFAQAWDGSAWREGTPYAPSDAAPGPLARMRTTPSSKQRAEAKRHADAAPQRDLL